MAASSLALVQLGPRRLEARQFRLPRIGKDDGILRIERCGLCGTDVARFGSDLSGVIPGHEPLGVVEEIGDEAARRWGIQAGDRVVVEALIPCRRCASCAAGGACPNRISIGRTSIEVEPGLFGGYAEHLYLHPNATVHKISPDVPADIAALYNVLACGVSWAAQIPATKLGDTVVILGGGQRGIACGIAAKAVGARTVILTGLTHDAHKLAVARKLGIDHTIDVEQEDLKQRVAEITAGRLADVVVDVVPGATDTVQDAVNVARVGGTIVLAGLKSAPATLETNDIVLKTIRILGASAKPSSAFKLAIDIIESGRFPLETLEPRSYPLSRATEAIAALAGSAPNEHPICVSLAPGR